MNEEFLGWARGRNAVSNKKFAHERSARMNFALIKSWQAPASGVFRHGER
ncbi:MAG TPA: hypothetical protein P5183_07000 [Smithellaceae bacterium]|nr:hypothetical protein [Smithellaceae bacterium]